MIGCCEHIMNKLYFPIKTPLMIGASFAITLILMLIALPPWLDYLRPQLVVLTLLYWLLYLPQRVGIVTAWCLGLILDVVYNVTLGEHALILVLIAYIALYLQTRINFFIFWQKLILVFLLVTMYLLPQFYAEFTGKGTFGVWLYWLSPFVSALAWPYMKQLLDLVHQRCRVI